jgi:hypothetical protein
MQLRGVETGKPDDLVIDAQRVAVDDGADPDTTFLGRRTSSSAAAPASAANTRRATIASRRVTAGSLLLN